jgi:hypothetical protein
MKHKQTYAKKVIVLIALEGFLNKFCILTYKEVDSSQAWIGMCFVRKQT